MEHVLRQKEHFPLADAVAHLPSATLGERAARGVLEGRSPSLRSGDIPVGLAPGGTLSLLDGSRRLLAVARFVAPDIPVGLLRVFREP